MTDPRAEIDRLTAEAERVGEGAAQVALFEEAVRVSNLHRDADTGYRVRRELIWPAYRAGRLDLVLVHYAWCLAHAERAGTVCNDLLWDYRMVVSSLPHFPEVPRPQIEAAVADLLERYRRAGASLRAVHVRRRSVAGCMGDRAAAAEADRLIRPAPRDGMTDDRETEEQFDVLYHRTREDDAEALRLAAPALAGRYANARVAAVVASAVLLPLVRSGRIDEARRLRTRVVPVIRASPRFLGSVGSHVQFLALIGDLGPAVRLVEKHLPDALTLPNQSARFHFALAARLLTDRLRAAGKDRTRPRLPAGFVAGAKAEPCPLDEFDGWLDPEAEGIAARFDARNGNASYSDKVRERAGLNGLADDRLRAALAGEDAA